MILPIESLYILWVIANWLVISLCILNVIHCIMFFCYIEIFYSISKDFSLIVPLRITRISRQCSFILFIVLYKKQCQISFHTHTERLWIHTYYTQFDNNVEIQVILFHIKILNCCRFAKRKDYEYMYLR